MDRRRKFVDALKQFMGRATFTGADRRQFLPETIKSPDFYDFL
jgi:hypothetical protein